MKTIGPDFLSGLNEVFQGNIDQVNFIQFPFNAIQEPCMTKLHPDCIHKVQNILDHRVCTTENRDKVLSIHNRKQWG